MFGGDRQGKKSAAATPIATLVGADARIDGNLSFKGGVRIDGVVVGNVVGDEGQQSMLVVSENARIEGEVRASHLVINGTVVGPVHGEELIELQAKARVVGNVRYRAIEMHHGAVVEGALSHIDGAARPGLKLAASND